MFSAKYKKVSVIIPTLDRSEVLIDTLNSLLRQDYPDFDIIVVDQTENQKKAVIDFIKKNPKIKYYYCAKKSSPHARNIGVQKANGEIMLFLDDDIEIRDKHFIWHHLENYYDNRIGLVGGRVIYDFNTTPPNHRQVGKLKFFGLLEITNFDAIRKMEIDHAPGGNLSCYKSLFIKVNGFEEIYKGNAHMEETDFCLKIKTTGYKLIFEPKAVLRHLQHKLGGNRVDDFYMFRYWLVHNFIVFYLKNFSKILFPLAFIKEFLWSLTSSLKRMDMKMFRIMTKAIFDGIKYYRTVSKEQL